MNYPVRGCQREKAVERGRVDPLLKYVNCRQGLVMGLYIKKIGGKCFMLCLGILITRGYLMNSAMLYWLCFNTAHTESMPLFEPHVICHKLRVTTFPEENKNRKLHPSRKRRVFCQKCFLVFVVLGAFLSISCAV